MVWIEKLITQGTSSGGNGYFRGFLCVLSKQKRNTSLQSAFLYKFRYQAPLQFRKTL